MAKLLSGTSARKIDRGGTGGRLRNIKFCLLEAKQEMDRAFMHSVATMVLLRDERHGRLLLRFAACTTNLEVRRVPWESCGTGSPTAENLVRATQRAYTQFCAHRLGKPEP